MKRYLLDTCAISDARQTRPNPGLEIWLSSVYFGALYVSVATIVELASGIEQLPPGKRRDGFERWLTQDIVPSFAGRILGATQSLIPTWARTRVAAHRHGNNADEIDFLIAATAIHHDLTLVTRNEKHFAGTGVAVLNPWSSERSLSRQPRSEPRKRA
jgi:predicted nucleic acid-binding protein